MAKVSAITFLGSVVGTPQPVFQCLRFPFHSGRLRPVAVERLEMGVLIEGGLGERSEVVIQFSFQGKFSYTMSVRGPFAGETVMVRRMRAFAM